MMHDNFKKLLRKAYFMGYTSNQKTQFTIFDFTDIYGFTGSSASDGNIFNTALLGTNTASFNSQTLLSNKSASDYLGSPTGNSALTYTALIGNSVENEHDYTLGSIIREGLILSTTINNNGNLIHNTVITNITNTDITYDEIGFFIAIKGSNSNDTWNTASSNSARAIVLLIKEVLDTPQTLPAQSSINVTFNILGDTLTVS